MPCLNEAETLEVCIRKAQSFLERSGIAGEIVIGDNGSTDGSQDQWKVLGALAGIPLVAVGLLVSANSVVSRGARSYAGSPWRAPSSRR
jgi:glycosyltransferase involved in cell wall biosynthesis